MKSSTAQKAFVPGSLQPPHTEEWAHRSERGGGFKVTKLVSAPPRLDDALWLPDENFDDLRTCRVGDCEIELIFVGAPLSPVVGLVAIADASLLCRVSLPFIEHGALPQWDACEV